MKRLILLTLSGLLVSVMSCSDDSTSPIEGVVQGDSNGLRDIDLSEIVSGGPPKDGIPALTDPGLLAGSAGDYLREEDRVIGVFRNGEARAYPLNLLWWHEIINDVVGGDPIIVTYCPLTGSGIVYDGFHESRRHTFGVSGRLYNNNLVCYDRAITSNPDRWMPQMYGATVTGPATGSLWPQLPMIETTWEHWLQLHPDTRVVSDATGWPRDYERYPYGNYRVDNTSIFFPLSDALDRRFVVKEMTFGVGIDGEFRAYPFSTLGNQPRIVHDEVGGTSIAIVFLPEQRAAWAFDRSSFPESSRFEISTLEGTLTIVESVSGGRWSVDGIPLDTTTLTPLALIENGYIAFWFAWSAFHPGIEVYTGG